MNVLQYSLAAIEQVSLEQLDESIAYLEETLQVMKTLRAVRAVMDRKPPKLLRDWESAVDIDRKEKTERSKKAWQELAAATKCPANEGPVKFALIRVLSKYQNGLSTDEIVAYAAQYGLKSYQVKQGLHNHKTNTFKYTNIGWVLREGVNPIYDEPEPINGEALKGETV